MIAITPNDLQSASWEDIALLYRPLIDQSLDRGDEEGIEQWLADWNLLDSALIEASTLALYDVSCDSIDAEKESIHLRFSSDIMPRHAELVTTLAAKLLDTGYTRPYLVTTLQRFRTERDIFRRENIALNQQIAALNNRYNSICGKMLVEWQGASVPVARLNPFLQHPDRAIREEAWRLGMQPYVDARDELADLFDQQLALRQQVALNAGFDIFLDYSFAKLHRYDYSPADCQSFHRATKQTFVPAATTIMNERERALGVGSLRPWDLPVDPWNRPALTPYASIDTLIGTAQHVFSQLDPAFGHQFAGLRSRNLLDLESREGKRPGGFCSPLPWQKQVVIFMNASGTSTDVQTLLHEAGHAFHEIAMADLPFVYQRHIGEEMCEVASMSMELLAAPYLQVDRGGFYTSEEGNRARTEHLESIVTMTPWISVVDAFQHWLYTDPAAMDRDARDRKFVEIWGEYDLHTDWTGLEDLRSARWYRQLHIFLFPFYYIEYGIAQLAALQVWKNSLHDPAVALADLRAAFALGGTRPLPELYARAGARMIFDQPGMSELVKVLQTELASLNGTPV